jgi:predicted NUDIX family phosphoesterase
MDEAVTAPELVLGLPRSRLMGENAWHGVLYGDVEPYLDLIAAEGTYRPRPEAEQDPGWKQVIPYLVLRDRGRLFLMRRTRAGGDARLHERWSIGIGGHLNPPDGDVRSGLAREFAEEIEAAWRPQPRLVGLLNDDSDPVGAVHVGIVFTAEAAGRPVAIRETEKLDGAFVAPRDVLRVYERLETWSRLLYDYLTERARGHHAEGRARVPGRRSGVG